MTSRRSYRSALDLDYTKSEIAKCSGTQFDPTIAKIFLDILEQEPEKIKEIQASSQDN
jgi:HD-GYP domain-containing protein (c-di-GMP phosphodiesterase class II)